MYAKEPRQNAVIGSLVGQAVSVRTSAGWPRRRVGTCRNPASLQGLILQGASQNARNMTPICVRSCRDCGVASMPHSEKSGPNQGLLKTFETRSLRETCHFHVHYLRVQLRFPLSRIGVHVPASTPSNSVLPMLFTLPVQAISTRLRAARSRLSKVPG